MTFGEALDVYTNALVVAVTRGGVSESADVCDRKALAAKHQVAKLYKAAVRGDTKRVRALREEVRRLERRLKRVRKAAGS